MRTRSFPPLRADRPGCFRKHGRLCRSHYTPGTLYVVRILAFCSERMGLLKPDNRQLQPTELAVCRVKGALEFSAEPSWSTVKMCTRYSTTLRHNVMCIPYQPRTDQRTRRHVRRRRLPTATYARPLAHRSVKAPGSLCRRLYIVVAPTQRPDPLPVTAGTHPVRNFRLIAQLRTPSSLCTPLLRFEQML